MFKRYAITLNLVLTFAILVLALFLPSLGARVVLAILALALFSKNLGKSAIPFVILALIISLVMSATGNFWGFIFDMGLERMHMSGSSRVVEPDTRAEGAKHVSVEITGVRIVVDPDMDGVSYPSDVSVNRVGDAIELKKKWRSGDITYVVKVGRVESLNVSGAGVELIGKGWNGMEKLYVRASGLELSGDLKASEMDLKAAGVKIDGNLSGDTLNVDGSGLKIGGYLSFKSIVLNGVGVLLDVDLEGVESFGVRSTSLEGRLNYKDSWDGERYLGVKGFGSLTVYLPKGAGRLNIESDLTSVKTVRR